VTFILYIFRAEVNETALYPGKLGVVKFIVSNAQTVLLNIFYVYILCR
jgi:hypothetical protein